MRAHKSARGSERKAEGKREKEEGVGALRRSFDVEARQSSIVHEGERVLPAHPRAFSLFRSPWPSQPLQSISWPFSLFLSWSLSPGGGHGPRFAVGTTRATGHEPRATRACPIQHPARDDTLPRHLLFPPSHSRFVPLGLLLILMHSLSLPHSGVHTRRVRPSQE